MGFTLSNGFTKLDNASDMQIISELPNALVKPYLFLVSRRSLRAENRRVGWTEVAAFCGRSQRQTHEALAALEALGLIDHDGKTWGFPGDFPGVSARKSSVRKAVKTVSDEEKPAPEVREVKEVKEGRQESVHVNSDVSLPARPLEKTEGQVQKTRDPLPAVPMNPAVAFFTEVCGSFFTRVAAAHLTRWHGQYSPEFITLAWTLSALQDRPTFVFQDWLDRSPGKTWPDPLKACYEADMAARYPSDMTSTVARERPVKLGDMVRLPDGSTATVERLDSSVFVTDHELDEYGYISYAAIGHDVEVLHS